jgi:HAD superfamily hydrolase (TIGR01509 family)
MKISTIYFDLGKVLLDYDFDIAFYRMSQESPLSEEDLQQRIPDVDPLITEYESGRIETDVFFKQLRDLFQYQGSEDQLQQIWCEIFTPIDEHIEMARILAEYYPLAMISNTSDAHIRFLEARHDFFEIFRERIYSYVFGTMKPDPSIYHHALDRMKGDKFEALFIDDREENIMTPSKMGWQTIHLRPDVNLRDALRSYELTGL